MEKSYRQIAYFFVGISIIIFIGFFESYFSFFPDLSKVDGFHHAHATVMILWLLLLIVQPILIRTRKFEIHRWIGRFSYFLVPVMVVLMLAAYHVQYEKLEGSISHEQNLGFLFLPLTDVLPFSVFYILAIVNKNYIQKHLRYIIGTALIVAPSGILRILVNYWKIPEPLVFEITTVLTAVLFIGFLLYDIIVAKKGFTKNIFATVFVIWAIPNILFFVIPQTSWWQKTAQFVVDKVF